MAGALQSSQDDPVRAVLARLTSEELRAECVCGGKTQSVLATCSTRRNLLLCCEAAEDGVAFSVDAGGSECTVGLGRVTTPPKDTGNTCVSKP
jgi:hypothetical protein